MNQPCDKQPARGAGRRVVLQTGASAVLVALGLADRASSAYAQSPPLQLVTPAEVDRFRADASENLSIPLSGDEPQIEVVRPVILQGKVASPVAIEVRFKPAAGRAIDPKSFKLYYGAFKLDVTNRLLTTTVVADSGFAIDKVDIPAGTHRLVMRVSDDTGVAGIREIRFAVEA